MELSRDYRQAQLRGIPANWKLVKLGEHAIFRTGPFGSAIHKSDYVSGGVPVVNPMQINDGRIEPTQSMTVTERAARQLADFRFCTGDVVIGRRGEMGRCAYVSEARSSWLCGTGSMIIRPSATVDGRFLQRVLSSPGTVAAITHTSVGSTMINLNQATLSNLYILFPPKSEQESIAEALDDADFVIELLERLVAKKRLVKRGVMQKLLCPRGGWTKKKLGSLVTLINGRAYSITEWEARGTPVLRLQNLTGRGDTYYYSNIDLPEKNYCESGDLLFMWSATFGPIIWRGPKAIFHYHIWKIECHPGAVDTTYLYYLLSEITERLKNNSSSGGTMLHLTKSGMEAMEISIPSFSEQETIAATLFDMDAEIEALELKLAKARQIKQGMMHNLLTGKIRLV